MANQSEIRIQKDFKPFPVLWHAAKCLREIREEEEVAGSYWAGLGALVMLAFAVEGFCQTEGPAVFGGDWLEGKEVERKPVLEKLKLIGRAAGIKVNYGQLPWSDVKLVLKARDTLAHPRPAKRKESAIMTIPHGVHPMDAAAHLVMEPWEPLIDLATAKKLAHSVDVALKEIWSGMGRNEWAMYMQGTTAYSMSTTR